MHIKGIALDTLDFILEASKSIAPKDFAGLLQEKDGIITGVILLPDTEVFEQNAVVKLFMMQHVKTEDSVHSHPDSNLKPSQADLYLFSNTGNCHIIVCHPYDRQSWACYDKEGNVRELDLIDIKIEDFAETSFEKPTL
jgi:proteasome lid subunit RPN8/RPN11